MEGDSEEADDLVRERGWMGEVFAPHPAAKGGMLAGVMNCVAGVMNCVGGTVGWAEAVSVLTASLPSPLLPPLFLSLLSFPPSFPLQLAMM